MTKRTDPHRPGAIIPAHYEYALSFNLSTTEDNWPVPSFGINCELDRRTEVDGETVNGKHSPDGLCCTIGLRLAGHKYALDGGPGRCTVCGAHYIYGDAWIYKPTGEVLFLGHDCAAKYTMLADRSEWELQHGRMRAAAATQLVKARNAEARRAFCAEHPGLEAALDGDHYILTDLKSKLTQHHELSEKQIALALKIANELKNPKAEEVRVPAPTGKQTFRGLVVSVKGQETAFGEVTRMTVKVTTPGGIWLAWGTAPASLMGHEHGPLKGCEVEVTAALRAGNEPYFAIMKRPRGKLVKTLCNPEFCRGCAIDRLGMPEYLRQCEVNSARHLEQRLRAAGDFDGAVRVQSRTDEDEFRHRAQVAQPKKRRAAKSTEQAVAP